MSPRSLADALAVALAHLPIQRAICHTPTGFVIVRRGDDHAVFDADAETKPAGLLPRHPIKGDVVAVVRPDGSVEVKP